MFTLGPFAFAAPWALLGLPALPALWFLLRLIPPAPREVVFPPVRILMALVRREETSASIPNPMCSSWEGKASLLKCGSFPR